MKDKLLIYNARLVDELIDVKNGAILISGNKIEGFPCSQAVKEMLSSGDVSSYNAQKKVVMPAFVDLHSHFRDPGFTQKEDIVSGCHAAAAGGFGTLILMPNTNPVISSQEAAEKNNKKAEDTGLCQTFQSVSLTKGFDGKTVSHLEGLNAKKVPLVSEDGKEVASSAVMLEAMKIAAKKNLVVSCHCEDPDLALQARSLRAEAIKILSSAGEKISSKDKKEAGKLLSRANQILAVAEDTATFRNIRLAKEAGCHLHLCHVSTANCVIAALEARSAGQNVTFEITPHHIGLSGTSGKELFQIVNPPLRSELDRQVLIDSLLEGFADAIATDHAPHTLEDKASGSPGFSGLETAFATCYSVLCLDNGMSLSDLSRLMSANPARILGLEDRGALEEGYLADLVIVDPEKEWTVRGEEFASRGKYTPLEGKKLVGEITATIHRGKFVFQS